MEHRVFKRYRNCKRLYFRSRLIILLNAKNRYNFKLNKERDTTN